MRTFFIIHIYIKINPPSSETWLFQNSFNINVGVDLAHYVIVNYIIDYTGETHPCLQKSGDYSIYGISAPRSHANYKCISMFLPMDRTKVDIYVCK